jgi:hypothetical protein
MFYFEINNWFRALARFCDYCIFYLVIGAITLSLPYFYGPFFYYFLAIAIPLLWIPVEAFFISKWTTTPGKALFGLSVRDAVGLPLSYKKALKWSAFLPGRPGTVYQKKTGWRRKLCAFLTSSVFVLAALYGNALMLWSVGLEKGELSGWVQYSSEEAGFTVSLPKDPELASKELVIPDSGKVLPYKEITSDESRKVHYSVSHLNLPRKWRFASNTTLLKGVLDVLVKHEPGALLLAKEFKTQGALRVLDYRMLQGEQEMQGRLIIVGGTLYKLTVIYPAAKGDQAQIVAFLNSFEKA